MTKIQLPLLELAAESESWDNLIRKFSIENQYDGSFLAKDFIELTAVLQTDEADSALTDTLDLIKFNARKNLADALMKKYRIGNEFAEDEDANVIFDRVFITAEGAAMASLEDTTYTLDTLIYIEVFYWVTLQVLRIARGKYVDKLNRGNQARLGENLDLAGSEFASLASQFYQDEV